MIVQNAGIVPCDGGNGSSTEEPRTALVAEPQQVPESLSIEGMFHHSPRTVLRMCHN